MENEIIKSNEPLTALAVREQVNLIQELMKSVMLEETHYGTIPGCGNKKTLFKAGAEKLSLVFRLRPVINNENDIIIDDLGNGHREYRVYCHIMSQNGIEQATGIGSCSTKESKYRYRGGEKLSTGVKAPIEYWNFKKAGKLEEAQKTIGGAGFSVSKFNGVYEICKLGEKQENTDIADTYNTVLKMAKKRAYIDGMLSATAASDLFVQDIEDLPEDMLNVQIEKEPIKQTPDMPKQKAKEPEEAKEQEENLIVCQKCGKQNVAGNVADYSKKKFNGKIYCFDCQKVQK